MTETTDLTVLPQVTLDLLITHRCGNEKLKNAQIKICGLQLKSAAETEIGSAGNRENRNKSGSFYRYLNSCAPTMVKVIHRGTVAK